MERIHNPSEEVKGFGKCPNCEATYYMVKIGLFKCVFCSEEFIIKG